MGEGEGGGGVLIKEIQRPEIRQSWDLRLQCVALIEALEAKLMFLPKCMPPLQIVLCTCVVFLRYSWAQAKSSLEHAS